MIELALNINALLSISYTDYEGFEVTWKHVYISM